MGKFKRKDIVMAAIPQSKPVRAEVQRLMRQWDNAETYEIRILTGSMRFSITHISVDGMTLVERDGKPV